MTHQNSNRKKILIIVPLFALLAAAVLYFFRDSNVDKKYTSVIDRYDPIYNEITTKFESLKIESDGSENRPSEGLIVDFRISKEDITKRKMPLLSDGFAQHIIQEVIISDNKAILFQLKSCQTIDCKISSSKSTGFYTHYLSKDKVDFINEKWVKIIEKKEINDWTYYIVRTKKG